jgi:DNA polymerase III delta prime subunit
MQIQRAQKRKGRARVALDGPSGSGKTLTALLFAEALGGEIGLVDSEHGSAGLYSDRIGFDTIPLETFSPRDYIKAVRLFADAGHDVLIVDSLSHAWTQGTLKMVDDYASTHKNDSYGGWRIARPEQNALISALLEYPGHVIVTMRSKMEYVRETNERGKVEIRKVGLAPVQSDDAPYEFDVVGSLDTDHTLRITKSRCPDLSDLVVKRPDGRVARRLLEWLEDGAEAPTDDVLIAEIIALLIAKQGKTEDEAKEITKAKERDTYWLKRAKTQLEAKPDLVAS